MRVVIVGIGNQGARRRAVAEDDVTATVDPVVPGAQYREIEQVPLDSYDAALVCTPDQAKLGVLHYLLARGKHVLVEKPLVAESDRPLRELDELARSTGAVCYTAYNHRFEPHVVRLRGLLDEGVLGPIYLARFCYGNGTARNVRGSPWRDQGLGVLSDLGSHLLDLALFLFGRTRHDFLPWSCQRFENRACDHFLFGTTEQPALSFEVSLLSWRNTFTVDIVGEHGSAHLHGLCKWGLSTLTVRRRVLPSGKPAEETETVKCADPTWTAEYRHFQELCRAGGTTIAKDLWINSVLNRLAHLTQARAAA